MLIAVASFSLMDAGLKMLSGHYPPMQVAALRGLSSLPLVFVWVVWTTGLGPLFRVRWGLHVLRGLMSVVMLAAFAYALRELPMAEAYSIFFIAPLLITALAVPLLGEHVGWRRWIAIGVGLAGVLIILRPSGEHMLSWGGLAVVLSAIGYAVSSIIVRVLARTDSTQSMVFWMLMMLSAFATIAAWSDWQPLRAQDAWILALLATSGAVGQYAVTEAFSRTAASVIAPFEYTALAWGMLLDWMIWQTYPDRVMLMGASVIVGSGLYLLHRERVVRGTV
jgi:drug/metabolite transporter (DMT)-like permease